MSNDEGYVILQTALKEIIATLKHEDTWHAFKAVEIARDAIFRAEEDNE